MLPPQLSRQTSIIYVLIIHVLITLFNDARELHVTDVLRESSVNYSCQQRSVELRKKGFSTHILVNTVAVATSLQCSTLSCGALPHRSHYNSANQVYYVNTLSMTNALRMKIQYKAAQSRSQLTKSKYYFNKYCPNRSVIIWYIIT